MAEQNSVFKQWANREKEATQSDKPQPVTPDRKPVVPPRMNTLTKSGETVTTTTNPLRKTSNPTPIPASVSPSKIVEKPVVISEPTTPHQSNDTTSFEIQDLKEQIESLQTKLKDQKARNEKLVQDRASTMLLVESLQSALNQTKESFSKQSELLEQERRKTAKKKAKIRSLKEQIEKMADSRDDAYAKINEENVLLQSANAKIEQLTEILRDRIENKEEDEEHQRVLEPAAAREFPTQSAAADSPPVSPPESRKFSGAISPSRSVSPPSSESRLNRSRTENNRAFRQIQSEVTDKSKVEKSLTMRNIFRRKNTTELPFQNSVSPPISPSTSPPNPSPIEEHSEKFSIPVQSNNLTLNTTLERTVTVKEVIDQLRKKFPGNTENYRLWVKTGKGSKSSTVRLEESRILASYKQVLDGKSKLIFTEDGKKKKKKDKRSDNALLSHLKDTDRKILEELYQAIKHEESEKVEFILQGSTVDIAECPLDGDGLTILHVAVKSKNVAIVEHFIEYYDRKQRNVNVKDKFGWTILHHSAFNCQGQPAEEEILRKLLDIPTLAVDILNDDKNLPLHYFAQKYTNLSCYEIGKSLIKKSPSTVNHKNKNGETPLHKAIFNPVVRMIMVNLLIEHGADVNTQNLTHGETVLHYAVRLGRRDLVKILMYHGADITLKDTTSGQTPLELAISSNQVDIADILQIAYDLFKWLQEFQLEELFVPLVKDDITVEHLSNTKEEDLNSILDRLGINNAFGTRIRFKKAWNMLQGKSGAHVGSSIFRRKSTTMNSMETINSSVIEHHQLEFTKEIGSGASGQVYRGLFKGVKVAIKVLKTDEKIKRELEIMNAVQSAHIIRCYGACMKPNVCVVMEYACKGSLYQVLHRDMEIGWEKGLKWAEDVTLGLKCLHTWSPVIVHRDIKSGNLLVNHDWDVKIGDLGLARFDNEQNNAAMQKVVGTYAYLAPEIYSGKRYSDKSDIFSLGIVLWEIVMRVLKGKYVNPYFDEYPNIVNEIQIPIQVAENHLRPTLPSECPASVATLIQSCLEAIPDKRPSSIQILEQLEAIRRELNVN